MEDPGGLGLRRWATFDSNLLKDHLREHPALKLMDVITERDAAILERNTAFAEKKTAYAERDGAFLQRDVAYADRNSALLERDAAMAALDMVRVERDRRLGNTNEAALRLMQMVNMAVSGPLLEADLQRGVPKSESGLSTVLDVRSTSEQGKQIIKARKENPRKRKAASLSGQDTTAVKSSSPKEKQQLSRESNAKVEKRKQEQEIVTSSTFIFDTATIPIPYCSCTGANQQCYRWGNGGWQSACCTNFISIYPLPVSPKKRGSRVPGRKMSGGAFKKLLGKLAVEGVNISCPVDLKNHWAKHGTNRYVTIK